MTPEHCSDCKFGTMLVPSNVAQCFCRRFPPYVFMGPGSPLILFPIMDRRQGWCGEYQPKLELTQ